jgi:hypothetical protein
MTLLRPRRQFWKSVSADAAKLNQGWVERREANWNRMMCKEQILLAIRHCWSIKERLFFADGQVYVIPAKCD